MKPETKYKLVNSIPFQMLLALFVIACLTGNYFYHAQSRMGEIVTWGIFVGVVIGFLAYIRVKNK